MQHFFKYIFFHRRPDFNIDLCVNVRVIVA